MPESTVGQFQPLHAAHSIESVQFSVSFATPIADANWAAVLAAARVFKKELPGEVPTMHMSVQGNGSSLQGQPAIALRRTGADGSIDAEFLVAPTVLMYRTLHYTRWKEGWSHAQKLMDAVLAEIDGGIDLAAVGLNVVDKFLWAGDSFGKGSLSTLLKPASKYVSPHVLGREDFWHSHTGAFMWHDKNTRRLVNVNLDHIEETRSGGPTRAIAITVVLSDQFQQAGYERLTDRVSGTSGVIDSHIQQLHVENKQILANIISNDIATRIALNSGTTI